MDWRVTDPPGHREAMRDENKEIEKVKGSRNNGMTETVRQSINDLYRKFDELDRTAKRSRFGHGKL